MTSRAYGEARHKFPSGFPDGRNAWEALRAFDLATGTELEIADAVWPRTPLGWAISP